MLVAHLQRVDVRYDSRIYSINIHAHTCEMCELSFFVFATITMWDRDRYDASTGGDTV